MTKHIMTKFLDSVVYPITSTTVLLLIYAVYITTLIEIVKMDFNECDDFYDLYFDILDKSTDE